MLGCSNVDVDMDRGRSGSALDGKVVSMSSGVSFESVSPFDDGAGDVILFLRLVV